MTLNHHRLPLRQVEDGSEVLFGVGCRNDRHINSIDKIDKMYNLYNLFQSITGSFFFAKF
jgi:hypothetical protein